MPLGHTNKHFINNFTIIILLLYMYDISDMWKHLPLCLYVNLKKNINLKINTSIIKILKFPRNVA